MPRPQRFPNRPQPPVVVKPPPRKVSWLRWAGRVIILGAIVVMCSLIFDTCRVIRLRTVNPEVSSLMEQRAGEAEDRGQTPRQVQTWVPLERISPHLQRAVLAGEDSNFATHNGFDMNPFKKPGPKHNATPPKKPKTKATRTTAVCCPTSICPRWPSNAGLRPLRSN